MQHYSPTQLAPLDRQAFQSLYRENLGPIYRYVYSKVRNREEAEDLTSQIFIKAVRHFDHAYNPHSTRSWLFQVARTTIADYWRVFYRSVTSSLDALVDADWEGPAEHEDEDQLFGFSSSADHVQRLLQALPERDREVLTCRFLLGLSVRETAVRMGLTEGNVKTSQFRALKHAADLGSYVSGEPAIHAGHELSAIDWFSWDALPEPLFSPFEHLLTGRCYPALWDFSGGDRS